MSTPTTTAGSTSRVRVTPHAHTPEPAGRRAGDAASAFRTVLDALWPRADESARFEGERGSPGDGTATPADAEPAERASTRAEGAASVESEPAQAEAGGASPSDGREGDPAERAGEAADGAGVAEASAAGAAERSAEPATAAVATIGAEAEVDLQRATLPTGFTRPVTIRSFNALVLHGRAGGAVAASGLGLPAAAEDGAGSEAGTPRRVVLGDPGLGGPVEWPTEAGAGVRAGEPDAGRGPWSGVSANSIGDADAAAGDEQAVAGKASGEAKSTGAGVARASVFTSAVVTVSVPAGSVAGSGAREGGSGTVGGVSGAAAGVGASRGSGERRGAKAAERSGEGASTKAASEEATARALRAQVSRGLAAAFARDGDEVRLALAPAALGEVRIRLKAEGGRVTGRIDVDSPEVGRLVESSLPSLRAGLEERGLAVGGLEVTVTVPAGVGEDGTRFVGAGVGHDARADSLPWNGAGTDAQGQRGGGFQEAPGRSPGDPRASPEFTGDAEAASGDAGALEVNLVTLRLDAVA